MGRRSRKRGRRGLDRPPAHGRPPARSSARARGSGADPPVAPSPARRSRRAPPPPAPWGRFPLAELCVLVALVIGVAGFATGGGRGGVMLACAAALGSLAGLELSIREHLAGYRSHSLVLAAGLAVAVGAAMYFAGVPHIVVLTLATTVFVTAFLGLRGLFKRRSGGLGFR